MAEYFVLYFAALGLVAWLISYFACRRSERFRCLLWGTRLHVCCAALLGGLVCLKPESELTQMIRPSFESAISYAHFLLFNSFAS